MRTEGRGATALAALALASCSRPSAPASNPQAANPEFRADVDHPTAPPAAGGRPRTICIDEAHGEFHTLGGRYAPFGAVLVADGYEVIAYAAELTQEALATCDVFVIANALHPDNAQSWDLPNPPAITAAEVAEVRAWVEAGGALWLIADHMPFPGAVGPLAAAFGFHSSNGFALRSGATPPDVFSRHGGEIVDHPVTIASEVMHAVDQVASFTGHAFTVPEGAQVILRMPSGFVSLEPTRAWVFEDSTPRVDVEGWAQAATIEVGRGRVAFFGEAAMLTSQVLDGGAPVGLDHPAARDNTALLRNVARWLSDVSVTQTSTNGSRTGP